MHPMHALSARDPMQQQQHQQQLQSLTNQDPRDQQQTTMTVLETLNPVQQQQQQQQHQSMSSNNNNNIEQQAQVMAMIDTVQVQRQQPHVVQQQHLVQQQPHLHQLQPSQQTIDQQAAANSIDQHQQHPQQIAEHPARAPQIISGEGIVADSGGPIVQWLLENYEIAEGESLPRSTVYNHYLAHCRQLQMASVNAASFGKLIRSVFVGLKTRRLGTRGHSKYHYFGVRAKQHVQHQLLQDQHHQLHLQQHDQLVGAASCSHDQSNDNSNHRTDEDGSDSDSTGGGGAAECGSRLSSSHSSQAKRFKRTSNQQQQQQQIAVVYQHHKSQQHNLDQQQQHTIELASNGLYYATNNGINSSGASTTTATNGYGKPMIQQQQLHSGHNGSQQQHHQHQGSPTLLDSCELADSRNHLGANWTTLVDEHWPSEQQLTKINGAGSAQYLELFESKYRSYYKRMVELLSELKFSEVEQLWQQFWRPTPNLNLNNHHQHHHHHHHLQQQQHQHHQSDAAVSDQSSTNGPVKGEMEQSWPSVVSMEANQAKGDTDVESGNVHNQMPNGHHQMSDGFQLQQKQQQQQQQVELTFESLYQLTSQPAVVERINQIDYSLYEAIESFLFPDMLSPIPSLLRQQIETFAINVGPCIEMAVRDYEPQFVAEKSKSARAFGYALRRYAELNRLSTASRAIWEKRSSLTQLSMDLSRIDLRYIEHQVSLMTNHKRSDNLIVRHNNHININNNNTDHHHYHRQDSPADKITTGIGSGNADASDTNRQQQHTSNESSTTTQSSINNENNSPLRENNLHHSSSNNNNHHQHHHLCTMQPGQLIQNFLHLLEDPYPANSWPDWCRNLFESRVCGLSMEEARNFVLDEWKNYISRIEKELTLRSAPSLSSFHLIKLLFGEYIDYLVDTRLAQARKSQQQQQLSA